MPFDARNETIKDSKKEESTTNEITNVIRKVKNTETQAKNGTTYNFQDLPDELILNVFSINLEPNELISYGQVSQRFKKISQTN